VTRDENTVEPFKRVLAGTMRAIARDDELEVSFGVQEASAAGHTAQLTQPPRDLDAASVARSRGEADALALKLRHHDAAKHAKRQPAGEIGRAIFDAVEQARCEGLGARRMKGVRENLAVVLEESCRAKGMHQIASQEETSLADVMGLMVRERMTGEKPPPSAAKAVDMARKWVEHKVGRDLDALIKTRRPIRAPSSPTPRPRTRTPIPIRPKARPRARAASRAPTTRPMPTAWTTRRPTTIRWPPSPPMPTTRT
jgi:cobaltochelatase CobT